MPVFALYADDIGAYRAHELSLADPIKASAVKGTVESVGTRSTHIRTGDGSLLVAANGKLAEWTVKTSHVRSRSVNTCLASIGMGGIVIERTGCLEVRNIDDERAYRTALMLNRLGVADGIQVQLGSPDLVAAPMLGAVAV